MAQVTPIRRFLIEQLDLCAYWFARVETRDTWENQGPLGDGESQAIRVRNQNGLLGVAKPGVPKTDGVCRAAHEKLAFDLAHILELPVPPVILWDRGEAYPDNRYLSISAWAFPQSKKWDSAQSEGIITDALRISAGPAISAMRVFHTWISDTDRKSDHTQVNPASPAGELQVAFIDHAFSMSQVWKGENHAVGECPRYMPAPEMQEIIAETADRIAALPESEVKRLVERIPASYLPDLQRQHTMSNLLSRKERLRAILAIP